MFCDKDTEKEPDFHQYTPEEFIGTEEAQKDNIERQHLLNAIDQRVQWGFGGTKADCANLSRGCEACGAGRWSCLFINNICNAGCFYCPDSQEDKAQPVSNSILFNSPGEYVRYLRKFGFNGCSISGGEPMMTEKMTLAYIKAVRNSFRDKMYIWIYTNGRLINKENLTALKNAGLDEIRFDISADRYSMEKVSMACGIIPVVTVEIPAIPEDTDKLESLLPALCKAGVKHINLHQIMMTHYNCVNMLRRGYHFTHNQSPLLPESELAALRIIRFVKDNNIGININYCSGIFQKRYQSIGYRRTFGMFVIKDYESFTDSGYIRTLSIIGTDDELRKAEKALEGSGTDINKLYMENGKLFFPVEMTENVKQLGYSPSASYSFAIIRPAVTYMNSFVEIKLTRNKSVVIERVTDAHNLSPGSEAARKYEVIETGLGNYD